MRAKSQEKCEKINKTRPNSVPCHLHCTKILTSLQHESHSPLQHQLTFWLLGKFTIPQSHTSSSKNERKSLRRLAVQFIDRQIVIIQGCNIIFFVRFCIKGPTRFHLRNTRRDSFRSKVRLELFRYCVPVEWMTGWAILRRTLLAPGDLEMKQWNMGTSRERAAHWAAACSGMSREAVLYALWTESERNMWAPPWAHPQESILQKVPVQLHVRLVYVADNGTGRSPVLSEQNWYCLLPETEGNTGTLKIRTTLMITNVRSGKSLIIYSCKSLWRAKTPVKMLETFIHFTFSSFISVIFLYILPL